MLTVVPEHRVQFPQRAFPKYSLTHVQHYRRPCGRVQEEGWKGMGSGIEAAPQRQKCGAACMLLYPLFGYRFIRPSSPMPK